MWEKGAKETPSEPPPVLCPYLAGSDGGGQDCCLKYSQRKIPYSIVRGYRKQEASLGCPIPAIL